jgi:BirA family biotin operon repressor/biotin-[acetyl-CoA-carboxylase] ligase
MERLLEDLTPRTRWLGQRLDLHREVDSTNLVAEGLARGGAPEGTIVLADAQSAGRGRMGRSFFSPGARSIYLSAILRPRERPEAAHRYIFVAALAVARTVRAFVPDAVDLAIKWPNDVLLDGRKTAGINLPVQAEQGRIVWAILGIGVNVNLTAEEFPPELRDLATSVRVAAGIETDRVQLAETLIETLEREIDRFREDGFAQVLEAWGKFFRMEGLRVRIGGPGVHPPIQGTVTGVDREGALLLRTDGGVKRFLAGDVTLIKEGE